MVQELEYGLAQWTGSRRTQLEAYAAAKGVEWTDLTTQVEFLLGEMTPGGGCDGYATYQFMTASYFGQTWSESDWENAQDIETATRAFCATFERPNDSAANSSISTRIQYAQEYYDLYAGTSWDEVTELGAQIIAIAATKLGYPYVWGAKGPNSFDCSGFTSWVYAQVGITITAYTEYQLSEAIRVVSVSSARVGDILYKSGHVAIYAGNGKTIEAMGAAYGVCYGNASRFTYALQFY